MSNNNLCQKVSKEEGCKETNCRHNIFWDKLNLNKKAGPTKVSLKFSNCMCLLNAELTLDEIGQLWGLSRERVRQIERDGRIKLLERGLNSKFITDLDFDPKIVKRKLSDLKRKKITKEGRRIDE